MKMAVVGREMQWMEEALLKLKRPLGCTDDSVHAAVVNLKMYFFEITAALDIFHLHVSV